MQVIKLTLIVCLIGLASVKLAQTQKVPTTQECYDKINSYLEKELVNNDDPQANMNKAADFLDHLEKKNKKFLSFTRESTTAMIQVLKQFLALRDVVAPSKCNDEDALNIIAMNDEAVGSPRMERFGNPPKNRVERVIHQLAQQHYDLCYRENISQYVDKLSQKSYTNVMTLSLEINTLQDFLGSNLQKKLVTEFIVKRKTKELGGAQVDQQVTNEDYTQYVVRPCQELAQLMGSCFKDKIEVPYKFYDIDPEVYYRISKRRNVVKHCQYILDNEYEFWNQLATFMKQ